MATYKEIQNYVKSKYGFQPKSCWIAHMKELCNIPAKISHNRYDLTKREKPCPVDKQTAIMDAFKYFGMIN